MKFREKNIVLSGLIKDESKLMYNRTPRERVQKVAPFLQLDRDPYPAIVGGKILWIVDGYTTSAGFPYSERTTLGEVVQDSQSRGPGLPQQQVNYIRNSVKATVDAFSGEVKLYTFDEDDPILKTWGKAFPGVLSPRSEISDELAAHFRYPEDLFKVQRELLGRYHITDAREFYQGDDYWQIPGDPASAQGNDNDDEPAAPGAPGAVLNASANAPDQPPYYVLSQFPGASKPSFNLTTAFTGRRSQNLTAVAAVSSDPEDYGTIRVLQLPRTVNIEGPRQVANRFNTDAGVRNDLLPIERGNAQVKPGNLLTLPVGGGLLYVQPIYVQARSDDSFPTLQLVLAAFGDRVASAPTLADALDELFGAGTAPRPSPGATPTPAPTASPVPGGTDVKSLVAAADQAFRDGQDALRRGDFAAYGEAQKRLQAALEQLARASGAAASPSPSAR